MVILIVAKDQQIIVGTFRGGMFTPHIMCSDDALALEGQQVALTVLTSEPDKVRTSLQNKSMHVYFKNISNALNAAGCDQRGIMAHIGRGSPSPWSEFSIKALWKSIQLARHGKDSTTKMTSAEYSEEHRIFDNMISECSGGVSCPLPSRESQSYE